MKPAARIGDPTAHGNPLAPGPGSPNVLIANKPAWRTVVDTHMCAMPNPIPAATPHGPGQVMMGSPTVLINMQMAVRMGDMVIEPGSMIGPDPIVMGAPNVLIGEGGGAATSMGLTMSLAKKAAAPFTKTNCNAAQESEINVDVPTPETTSATQPAEDPFKVPKGQITFDSEGLESPDPTSKSHRYHSRKPHVPTDSSGVTIGRGYDMKTKSKDKIISDLTKSGVDKKTAEKLAGAAGLSGKEAKDYITKNELDKIEITPKQQKELFAISYQEAEDDVKRICDKEDVQKAYGKTDWDKLDPAIKDILVDLRFRGDYTGDTRKNIQKHVVNDDLQGLKDALEDDTKWIGVKGSAPDRHERRKQYAKDAVDAKQNITPSG